MAASDARSVEIERKFLVRSLPEGLDSYRSILIRQGYLASTSRGEVRLRRLGTDHYVTLKCGHGLARSEDEVELDQDQFNVLWPLTKGKRVEKIRYSIPWVAGIIELDVFQDALEGLYLAEIEFDSVSTAERFAPPEWFGREVTQDERYKNKNLALHGRPE